MRRARLPQTRIDILKRSQLRYWTSHFGVSVETLREAVLKVGTRSERVALELGKNP